MSHPVASESDRIRIRGVFPMHSSSPFLMSSFPAGCWKSFRRCRPRVWAARTAVAPRATPPSTSVAGENLSMAVCRCRCRSVSVVLMRRRRCGVEVRVAPREHSAAPPLHHPPPYTPHTSPPQWTPPSSPLSSARSSASAPVSGRCGPLPCWPTGATFPSPSRLTAARTYGSRGARFCSATAAPSLSVIPW